MRAANISSVVDLSVRSDMAVVWPVYLSSCEKEEGARGIRRRYYHTSRLHLEEEGEKAQNGGVVRDVIYPIIPGRRKEWKKRAAAKASEQQRDDGATQFYRLRTA